MSERQSRWAFYIMLLYIAALVAAEKIARFDSFWIALFATGLMLPASRMEARQGGNEVPSRSDDSPTADSGDAQP